MKSMRVVVACGALLVSAAALGAQQSNPPKPGKAVRDSIKALTKDIKADEANRKKAKAAHDTTQAKADTKEIKQDKAERKALKAKLPKHKKPTSTTPPKP